MKYVKEKWWRAFNASMHYYLKKRGYSGNMGRGLSSFLGISTNLAPLWMTGANAPNVDTLADVAEKLKCEPWQLLHPNIEKLNKDLEKLRRIESIINEEEKAAETIKVSH